MVYYIVTRTVPGLQMMRVDVDNRGLWNDRWFYWKTRRRDDLYVAAHRPATLRARFWRWLLGG